MAEKLTPQELSPKECLRITNITESSLDSFELDGIYPDNIEEIIKTAKNHLITVRKKYHKNRGEKTIERSWQDMLSSYSKSHRLYCSVNSAFDAEQFGRFFLKKLDPQKPETLFVKIFFERRAQNNQLLTSLFEIDIIRRVGEAKKDQRFIEKSKKLLWELVPKINQSLDDFLNTNADTLKSLPPETKDYIEKYIQALKDTIDNPEKIPFDEKFYFLV